MSCPFLNVARSPASGLTARLAIHWTSRRRRTHRLSRSVQLSAIGTAADAVVLLSAPVDVLLARVVDRANPFGSRPEERAKIARDLAEFEPLLRAGDDAAPV